MATMRGVNDPTNGPGDQGHGVVDVQQIVDDIRDRVEQGRLTDRRAVRAFGRDRVELQPGRVVLRPEVTVSSRRGVGTALSAAKRFQLRFIWAFLMDLVAQINAAFDVNRLTMAAESRRRVQLERHIVELEGRIQELEGRLLTDPAHATPGQS